MKFKTGDIIRNPDPFVTRDYLYNLVLADDGEINGVFTDGVYPGDGETLDHEEYKDVEWELYSDSMNES